MNQKKSISLLDYIQCATFSMIFTAIFGEYVPLPKMDGDKFNNHKNIWDEIVNNALQREIYEHALKPFYKRKQSAKADKSWAMIWKWVKKFDENGKNPKGAVSKFDFRTQKF